jgi:hypothetical protein
MDWRGNRYPGCDPDRSLKVLKGEAKKWIHG